MAGLKPAAAITTAGVFRGKAFPLKSFAALPAQQLVTLLQPSVAAVLAAVFVNGREPPHTDAMRAGLVIQLQRDVLL